MNRFIVLLLLPLILNCSRQDKTKTIEEELFVKIYMAVVSEAEAYPQGQEKWKACVDSILQSYNVSRENFDYTVDYYNEDPQRWERFFQKVVAELESKNPPQSF